MELRHGLGNDREFIRSVEFGVDPDEQIEVAVTICLLVESASGKRLRPAGLTELNQVARQSEFNVAALGSYFENALVYRDQRIGCTLAHHLFHNGFVLRDGFVEQFFLAKQLRNLHTTRGVTRIQGRHFAKQFECFWLLAVCVVAVGRGLECADRFCV